MSPPRVGDSTLHDERIEALVRWLSHRLGRPPHGLHPIAGDASFRRYFRVFGEEGTWIAMDAPPHREALAPFLHAAGIFAAVDIHVPRVHAADERHGFLLLDDLGETSYLDCLTTGNADALYGDALEVLFVLHHRIDPQGARLPLYDEALLSRELDLFREWFLCGLLKLGIDAEEEALWERLQAILLASALSQPRVVVHRDFHSRNLMVTERNNPGVLDFQDAVIGPLTYDLVSLLRDCYIAWPEERVRNWLEDYRRRLRTHDQRVPDAETFRRWFDLMGLQRHLKALGIFARLKLRDGKPRYLADIPRTLAYVSSVSERYRELRQFHSFLERRVVPALEEAGIA
ncbi:MAG TPA: phosphotransferase [Methylococcus sp.]|nr:phosphotransferase [Methylococcus sp.]